VKDKKASKTEVSAIEFLFADLDPNEAEAPEDANRNDRERLCVRLVCGFTCARAIKDRFGVA